MEITDKITNIKGVGEKTGASFAKMGIYNIQNLFEHYPRGYDVYKPLVAISQVREGEIVAIEASLVSAIKIKRVRNLQIINCMVKDFSESISLTWFNMSFLRNTLRMGTKYIFRGNAALKNGILVIEQPQILTKEEYYNRLNVLQPIYSLTAGISNNAILKAMRQALKEVDFTGDFLPLDIRKENNLIDYKSAIKGIHFPKDNQNMMNARRRIVFEEFFLFALALNQLKKDRILKMTQYRIEKVTACDELLNKLPYHLTKAQKKVWEEIESDLSGRLVMNRLVQGDVGSGKTIIAVLALLMAVKNGYQGSIMVPTEVLAKQHYQAFIELLSPLHVKIALLVGSMTAKEKKAAYEAIEHHQVDIIVGTHALIQEKVKYQKLALVITDEQHRFGVKQREALSGKGEEPHMLVMSATPIPRTLAIILYGDLDLSIIDELPSNRLPIKNCVVNTNYRSTAYHFIEREVLDGRQAYVICPMIEEREGIEVENVLEYTQKLRESLSASICVEYLHGKMKAKEKNEIMEKYSKGEIQVLVSTTVVEVGINVPNATVMMIENAERFGLAQLHQLRGRVGRGGYQSYCILVSGSYGKDTKKRLGILNKSNDGFYIANEDLKLRGPGDLFGIRQSGMLEFAMADVFNDADILKVANEAAKQITSNEVKQMCKKYQSLREKISLYSEGLFL
jgi:ATP-dependent DNA helicase RecG